MLVSSFVGVLFQCLVSGCLPAMTGHAEAGTTDHLNSQAQGTGRSERGPGGEHIKRIRLLVSPLVAKRLKAPVPAEEDRLLDFNECTGFGDRWAVPRCMDANTSKPTNASVRQLDVIDLELSQVQRQFGLGPFHRGRWILNLSSSYTTSHLKHPSTDWATLCKLVAKRHLSDCTAFQHSPSIFWVYCNFSQALEVYDTLKKKLNFQKPAEYFVPTHGVVFDRC